MVGLKPPSPNLSEIPVFWSSFRCAKTKKKESNEKPKNKGDLVFGGMRLRNNS